MNVQRGARIGINLCGTIYLGGDDLKAAFSRSAARRGCFPRDDINTLCGAYLFLGGNRSPGGAMRMGWILRSEAVSLQDGRSLGGAIKHPLGPALCKWHMFGDRGLRLPTAAACSLPAQGGPEIGFTGPSHGAGGSNLSPE